MFTTPVNRYLVLPATQDTSSGSMPFQMMLGSPKGNMPWRMEHAAVLVGFRLFITLSFFDNSSLGPGPSVFVLHKGMVLNFFIVICIRLLPPHENLNTDCTFASFWCIAKAGTFNGGQWRVVECLLFRIGLGVRIILTLFHRPHDEPHFFWSSVGRWWNTFYCPITQRSLLLDKQWASQLYPW